MGGAGEKKGGTAGMGGKESERAGIGILQLPQSLLFVIRFHQDGHLSAGH